MDREMLVKRMTANEARYEETHTSWNAMSLNRLIDLPTSEEGLVEVGFLSQNPLVSGQVVRREPGRLGGDAGKRCKDDFVVVPEVHPELGLREGVLAVSSAQGCEGEYGVQADDVRCCS